MSEKFQVFGGEIFNIFEQACFVMRVTCPLVSHIIGKCSPEDSNFIFDRIFIKLSDNKDNYKILDEFEFGFNRTFQMRLNCCLVCVKHWENVVRMIATSFVYARLKNGRIMLCPSAFIRPSVNYTFTDNFSYSLHPKKLKLD